MTLKNVPKYGAHNFVFGSRHRGTDICGVCELPKQDCERKYKPVFKTCQWYVSIERTECGEPAAHRVKVKTKVTEAFVDLCDEHKSVHDDNFARIRTERAKLKK